MSRRLCTKCMMLILRIYVREMLRITSNSNQVEIVKNKEEKINKKDPNVVVHRSLQNFEQAKKIFIYVSRKSEPRVYLNFPS